ncbi:MAG: iron-containing alcohol dehydrogenase family protein [Halanaeroarchaeum sp.]
MLSIPESFEDDYAGTTLVYGRGAVADLGATLAEQGLERAVVVTGTNVGANPAVMERVSAGLGDRLVSVFDETTPQKLGATVFDGIDVMRHTDPDVLVGVGGGSSLDVARQMSVLAADGRSLEDLRNAAREGDLPPPDPGQSPTDVVVVPTTFAGADVSSGGAIEVLSADESPTGDPIRIRGTIRPTAVVHDPDLFETTPMGALAGSAMNGFDKGIETIYARTATPITDATAVRGLRLLRDALPRLPDDPAAMERAVVGTILVQYERRPSIVHALGHGFAERYDIQQGIVHAVVVPHVLRFLFDRVDARRTVLAEGLGIDAEVMDEADLAVAIIEEVEAVRAALDLPDRLRDLVPTREDDLSAIARSILADRMMDVAPAHLDPTVDDIEVVLTEAW